MLYARLPAALLALLALCALLACARAEVRAGTGSRSTAPLRHSFCWLPPASNISAAAAACAPSRLPPLHASLPTLGPPPLPPAHPEQTAEVRSCAELRAALGDAGVDHVLLMPRPGPGGGWNCTSDDLPERGVEIAGREVLIEGHGPEPVYYNVRKLPPPPPAGGGTKGRRRGAPGACCIHARRHAKGQRLWPKRGRRACVATSACSSPAPSPLTRLLRPHEPPGPQANRGGNQVLVGQGGNVTVRNLWLDNCVRTLDPFVCLVNALREWWRDFGHLAWTGSMPLGVCLAARRSGVAASPQAARACPAGQLPALFFVPTPQTHPPEPHPLSRARSPGLQRAAGCRWSTCK